MTFQSPRYAAYALDDGHAPVTLDIDHRLPKHQVPPGTPLRILAVNRYYLSGWGPFVGVLGTMQTRELGEVGFLYQWSDSNGLVRAPWEPESVPARRPME